MNGAIAISERDDWRDLAGMAVARLAQSIREGCARDACTWMRVYERLQRHVAAHEAAARPASPITPPAAVSPEPAPDGPIADARPASPVTPADPAALDASDSLDRVFFDAVLSAWPSGAPGARTGRRQTGMAP